MNHNTSSIKEQPDIFVENDSVRDQDLKQRPVSILDHDSQNSAENGHKIGGFVCLGLVGATNIHLALHRIQHYHHFAFSHPLCLRLPLLDIFAQITVVGVEQFCHLDQPVNSRVMNNVQQSQLDCLMKV